MIQNEIIDEIHRHRAAHARACNYDVAAIFAEMRTELARLKSEGWTVVTLPPHRVPGPCVVREEPPGEQP